MAQIDLLHSDTKRALLQLMKRRGDVSLDEAVAATALARTTLREHLTQLEQDGFVEHYARRQGRGRPSLRYRLTERGDRLFPARDGMLLRELLAYLERTGQADLIEAFFTSFWEARLREADHRLEDVPSEDQARRLEVVRRLLHEQGFMPEIHVDDAEVVIRECNCPFPEAVKTTRLPCRLEAQFFEHLLGTEARRVSYIPEGHAACSYAFPSQNVDYEGSAS